MKPAIHSEHWLDPKDPKNQTDNVDGDFLDHFDTAGHQYGQVVTPGECRAPAESVLFHCDTFQHAQLSRPLHLWVCCGEVGGRVLGRYSTVFGFWGRLHTSALCFQVKGWKDSLPVVHLQVTCFFEIQRVVNHEDAEL